MRLTTHLSCTPKLITALLISVFIISGCDNTAPSATSNASDNTSSITNRQDTNSQNTNSQNIDGLYFNAASEQLLFIDTQAAHNPVVVHNYLSVVKNYQLTYLEQLTEPASNTILEKNAHSWLEQAGNIAITRASANSVIFDMKDSRMLKGLVFERLTPQTTPAIEIKAQDDEAGAIFTLNKDLSYTIALPFIAPTCELSGQLIDTGRGYWQDDNARLSTSCDSEQFKPGTYRAIAYSYWLKNDQGENKHYFSAAAIPTDPAVSRALWGGVEVK